jgi:hypothetical protein
MFIFINYLLLIIMTVLLLVIMSNKIKNKHKIKSMNRNISYILAINENK